MGVIITHVVFFKLKDKGKISQTKQVLADMEGKIPELRYLEVGVDIIRSERSYDIALIAKFDSLQDLDSYRVHPVHQRVIEFINGVKESVIAVDYEG